MKDNKYSMSPGKDCVLLFAEFTRAIKLLKFYPIDTINNIISFLVMSVIFMIGINAVGDSSQVFGVVFFPVMLNLISGPSASIRNDIELGVFEQVYISQYSLIKIAIIRTIVSGLTSIIGSILIALVMHIFFLRISIPLWQIVLLFGIFSVQSILMGVIMAAITLRFRKVETLMNFINILIMIELVLPLNNTVPVVGYTPMIFVPFWGIVAFYQQLIVNSLTSSTLTYTLICTLINTILICIIAQFSYKKCLIASKKSGNLGQY